MPNYGVVRGYGTPRPLDDLLRRMTLPAHRYCPFPAVRIHPNTHAELGLVPRGKPTLEGNHVRRKILGCLVDDYHGEVA